MPTKKKRIGFIPREDVMRIISELSFENNLSNSKIISILVEEALIKRGIYNLKKDNSQQDFDATKIKYNQVSSSSEEPHRSTNKSLLDENLVFNKMIRNNKKEDLFDLLTYEKFLKFLKFQEMIEKYET